MICSPHIKDKISMPYIELVNTIVPISTVARNIGVFFDDVLSIKSHVQHVCRVAYYHLHNIGRIRNLLNQKTTEMMVHVYVISRLDNGNGLLYGSSDYLLTIFLPSSKECKMLHPVSYPELRDAITSHLF